MAQQSPVSQAPELEKSASLFIDQMSQNINRFVKSNKFSPATVSHLQAVNDHILNTRLPNNYTSANANRRNKNDNNNNNYQHQHSPTNNTNNNNNNNHAHDNMEVDEHKKTSPTRSSRNNRRNTRNKQKYGDPAIRTDDEIKDRLATFIKRHRMPKYLEQADEKRFDKFARDSDGNRQITVKPRLVIKNFYRKNKPQWQSHRKILDALWSIDGYQNPFIYLEPDKLKIQQSGIDLIIMIKEDVGEFTTNVADTNYDIEIENDKYTLQHQKARMVYHECRMILEGVPRRYFNYAELKKEVMNGFQRKIHNKLILQKLKEIDHPQYGRYKKINEINPSIFLSWDMISSNKKLNKEQIIDLKRKMFKKTNEMTPITNIMAIQRERTDDKGVPSKVHVSIRGIPEKYFHDNILINDAVVKVVYDVRFIAESVVLQRIPQCYHCWGLGHFKDRCHRLDYVWCRRCGEKGHEQQQCQKQAHCALCGGKHRAYKSSCPGFIPLINIYRTGKDLIR